MQLLKLATPPSTVKNTDPAPGFRDHAGTVAEFFGFSGNPFSDAVNPAYFYKTATHEEAFLKMMVSVEQDISLGLVTGTSGTGKTLLTQMLLYNLDPACYTPVVVLVSPGMTKTALLREILLELDPEFDDSIRQTGDLLRLLHAHIIDLYRQQKKPVIIIDEAHFLCADSLHILRTISNIEIPEKKLVTCLLFSESRLLRRLQHPSYESLRNRIYLKVGLETLAENDVRQYIKFRLLVAGTREDVFEQDAFPLIQAASGGTCRMVNKICHNCLLEAFVQGEHHVSAAVVRKITAPAK
ncbi:MAG: AAA family ATPase [Deltaproteobacteria bacterium]|nr:AAA family ATPase [Deltaproteobacteria bacterium]